MTRHTSPTGKPAQDPSFLYGTGLSMPSREEEDFSETNLLRDVAFNRHSMNDGHHVSPLDNGKIQIGADGIEVRLVQPVDEEKFKRVISMATRATIGLDLSGKTIDDLLAEDNRDWEEMLKGGLQTALETSVIVFAVSGVSRTCTHQLVRSRKASFHQQSQRASYYGDRPEARMPESVWRNLRARNAWLAAKDASDEAYRIACEEDISYQDARYVLLEGTDNYIMCEYTVREFMNVFAYRGCSMFSWEIVAVMREMRRLLIEAHPWLEPYVKISCEASKRCTFQGWETVEGQCDFPWAQEENRTFKPQFHKIGRRPGMEKD
jgi:flavin-dependent thymidylate synthase